MLNYHHLYYFYVTAREGSLAKASGKLHVTPQTVSGQISTFEETIGFPLFERIGRRMHLNERGQTVYAHAEEIFQKGAQLTELLRTGASGQTQEFVVGLTDAIPKILAHDFMQPVLLANPAVRFVFREGAFDNLVADMAINHIHLVLADHGIAPGAGVRASDVALGESDLSFFASPRLADELTGDFPHSLNNAPFLLPGENSGILHSLLSWLEQEQLYPHITGEFDDSALLKIFGSEGFGVFCSPSCVSEHVESQYRVKCIGKTDQVNERFYALTRRNQRDHAIVNQVIASAKRVLS